MENFNGGGTYRNHLWYVVFAAFVFSFFLFFFDSSTLLATKNVVQTKKNYVDSVSSLSPVPKRIGNIFRKDMEPLNQIDLGPGENLVKQKIKPVQEKDPCLGKYIYVHTLPSKFNSDMLKECQTLCGWIDMCLYLLNEGLGPKLDNKTKGGWFATDQFALDVIFHKRMMQYKCLTKNSSLASAIYLPFYAGLDVGRYLWTYNATLRDSASQSLVKWLTRKPEWQVMGGRDHFMVAGRITWDFRRLTDKDTDWGNNLMVLPETKNMTMLVLESSPWHSNDFAIPYPTYFHPSSDNEVFQWQNRMRRHKKKYLYSFAGAPRPNLVDSIRGQIIEQCQRSKGKCKLLECSKADDYCRSPVPVMKMFQDSVFCLQPPGDSYTRRSAFDSILAGCIPVFFHPGSAYVQYTWHLPLNYTRYSVFIPADEVRTGKVKIETVLSRVSKDDVRAMREEVIGLIPKLVYADPRARLETVEDAFDMSVKGVIEKVNEVRRKGWVSPTYIEEQNYWKYSLFGTVEKHEWDRFFIYN